VKDEGLTQGSYELALVVPLLLPHDEVTEALVVLLVVLEVVEELEVVLLLQSLQLGVVEERDELEEYQTLLATG